MLGPPALRFLALVELSSLCRDDQPLPLLALARLKRLLGPALTRQARGAETSQVRMAASVLRSRLEQDIFGPGDRLPDGVVAAQVPAYLRRLQLPAIFTAPSADSREIYFSWLRLPSTVSAGQRIAGGWRTAAFTTPPSSPSSTATS